MKLVRKFALIGGPYGGTVGEFDDIRQKVAYFGPIEGRSFAYKRSKVHAETDPVLFKFHRGLTARRLAEKGLSPGMIRDMLEVTEPIEQPNDGKRVEVTRNADSGRWEMRCEGEVLATRAEIADRAAARRWVQEVFEDALAH